MTKKEVQEGFGQVMVSELYRWLRTLIIFMILRLNTLQTYKANNLPRKGCKFAKKSVDLAHSQHLFRA
jgi:hypothetical protein